MDAASPIAGPGYSPRAHDLARFVDEPADDVVGSYVAAGHRRPLDTGDCYTLLLFARRAAARAFRANDVGLARLALDALMLVDIDRIDYRDFNVDFALLAIRELGGDGDASLADAVERASPGAAGHLVAARERIHRIDLADCGLLRVESSYGVGFIETWTHRHPPSAELAARAVSLADAVDAEGTYRADHLVATELPGVWFGRKSTVDLATNGCISINCEHHASRQAFGHSILVFVAELADDGEAARLARAAVEAAGPDRPTAATHAGPLLAVFVGGSFVDGQPPTETHDSMRRFTALL